MANGDKPPGSVDVTVAWTKNNMLKSEGVHIDCCHEDPLLIAAEVLLAVGKIQKEYAQPVPEEKPAQ